MVRQISAIFAVACLCFFPVSVSGGKTGDFVDKNIIPAYGNYCGPGWSSGRRWKSGEVKDICKGRLTVIGNRVFVGDRELARAIDELDLLCVYHDRAYCAPDKSAHYNADKKFLGELKSLCASKKTIPQSQWHGTNPYFNESEILPKKDKRMLNYCKVAIPLFRIKISKSFAINNVVYGIYKETFKKMFKPWLAADFTPKSF